MSRGWQRLGRAWPFWVLGALTAVFVLMLVFSRKAPNIAALQPAMAAPGQTVVISGDYFGRTEQEGILNLAGEIPPPSLIQSWSDQRIVFVVPEDASSGLVTISNSQGTSRGVLFTNTASIPIVLQQPGGPGQPLLWAATPSSPLPGQTVTVNGRGLGLGDEAVVLKVSVPSGGPVLEIGPRESLTWLDGAVSFRWPSGAPVDSTISVTTPRGTSAPFPLGGTSPMIFEAPRTLSVEVRAGLTVPPETNVVLWGAVPSRESGTAWFLESAEPRPLEGGRDPLFRWSSGPGGPQTLRYTLRLTSWTRHWMGLSAGVVPASIDAPTVGGPAGGLWKSASAALKTLTAKWGLETPDPWLRLQRLQTGMASLPAQVGPDETPQLTQAPGALLSGVKLNSFEISSLGVALATQAGLTARLVGGLWVSDQGVVPRTWAEVWIPGAGWVSWDIIDGNPGALDNRHFAFDVRSSAEERLLPRSSPFGPGVPGTLRSASGEFQGSGAEPVVQWQITRSEK